MQCYDIEALLLAQYVQFVYGQDTAMPAPNTTTYMLQCQIGFNWADNVKYKNISCIKNRWEALPLPCLSMLKV